MRSDNDVVTEGQDEEDTVTPLLSEQAVAVDFLNALDPLPEQGNQ